MQEALLINTARLLRYGMKSYDFGNYANQQPVNVYNFIYPAGVAASKIKLVSTGHGGPSNTSNAAEFYDATHHIYVNNVNTFTQHNWTTCNPNPDNCQSSERNMAI